MTLRPAARRDSLRIGVISDIHAHADALVQALDLLERLEVDRVVCLGDVVEKGPRPNMVVRTLERRLILTVKGNHDDNAVRHAALDGRAGGLSRDSIAWLDALPWRRDLSWAGRYVTLAHASLGSDTLGVRPGRVPKCMRRALRGCDADVVLLGHTHRPMRWRYGARWICNPGSLAHGRTALGSTCAVLSLPSMEFCVYRLATGEAVELGAPSDHEPG